MNKGFTDAKGGVDKFDGFHFAMCPDNSITTMKLSGKDLRQAVGTSKHTRSLAKRSLACRVSRRRRNSKHQYNPFR